MKKNRPLYKQIVSGEFKGKRLKLPSKTTTRSSKGIVLESFFNTVQFDIVGAAFVEVFSGSGSVGLEALSRGASHLYFMEKDRAAQQVLRENIAQTDPSRCEVFEGDSFVNIGRVLDRLKTRGEDAYFYIDPPFSIREGHEDIYEKMIRMIAQLPKDRVRMVIIEHMSGLELADPIGPFAKSKSKKFGKTSLTYYT
jgi:16S rRNA (guanine966-N2)-methyltransferase